MSIITPVGAAAGAPPAPSAKLATRAQQFEAIFTREILGQARKARFDDSSDNAMDTFASMEDSQFADIASAHDALGIGGMLQKALAQRLHANGATTAGTGQQGSG